DLVGGRRQESGGDRVQDSSRPSHRRSGEAGPEDRERQGRSLPHSRTALVQVPEIGSAGRYSFPDAEMALRTKAFLSSLSSISSAMRRYNSPASRAFAAARFTTTLATAPMYLARAASALASVCASMFDALGGADCCRAAPVRFGFPVGVDLSPENILTNAARSFSSAMSADTISARPETV